MYENQQRKENAPALCPYVKFIAYLKMPYSRQEVNVFEFHRKREQQISLRPKRGLAARQIRGFKSKPRRCLW